MKIAVLGFGVVGSGVAELFDKNCASIARKAGQDLKIKYILDIRSLADTPWRDKAACDFEQILLDPDVCLVIETIGGLNPAYDYTKRCLMAKKHVVTSNKELVATHGEELLTLAHANNVNYLFEASVGGGIPIIRPISQCLAANNIDEICGILNGTTNYILTSMGETGVDFDEALTQAQAKGYAEANPAADIQGHDTCRKICILASLSFGHHIYPDKVQTQGIEQITSQDIQYAKENNFAIKLIGRAKRLDNQTACVYVAPHMVKNSNVLANVSDVFNGITINGDAIGEVMFYGRGAGAMPTASAVVADVIDAVKHFHAHKYLSWEKSTGDPVPPNDIATPWYLRDGNKQTITPTLTDWKPWASENGFSEAAFAMRVL